MNHAVVCHNLHRLIGSVEANDHPATQRVIAHFTRCGWATLTLAETGGSHTPTTSGTGQTARSGSTTATQVK